MVSNMSHLDYMKIIDIAASTLEHGSDLQVNATDLKVYAAKIRLSDASAVNIKIEIGDYDLEFNLNKKEISPKRFRKWISEFEYELEQVFLDNVKMSYKENRDEYILTIAF